MMDGIERGADPALQAIAAYRIAWRPLRDAVAIAKVIVAVSAYGAAAWLACRSGNAMAKGAWVIVAGFVMSGFLNLAHECLHRSLVRARFVNAAVGRIAANFLFVNYVAYTDKHLKHHRCLATSEDTESTGRFDSLRAYLAAMSGIGFLVANLRLNAHLIAGRMPSYLASGERRVAARKEAGCVAVWFAAATAATCAWPVDMLLRYVGPLLCAYFWLMFFGLPEHYGCEPAQPRYRVSRSVTSNCVVRFFMWNANFHTEHHRYPGAPAAMLARIASRWPAGIYRESSYLKWHWHVCRALLRR
ncbi:fatty acid desaturase family protein [Burkholderia ubonensis]|uniref:Fatty acid desaturase domain-containing protein n=2 Tax=Burkholderia ubonensis TaxID=101571 RepID=A0A118WV54_9BURK|nr:fatty acid desaturase [Burkholderia ubonensis]KVS51536.1 hypothetical protein WK37_03565 [Burkholderia ubonensis]KVS51970.1 hypothetical protein WK38_11995 [Burkholderia ubonensis]KVS74717.1 hypothetical protein WK42_21830 [Burkholderia ubonensis]KVS86050.1 hypothetical protein WK43_01120 [Burkholderia ubonensis]KVS86167.1 hypothetical protein WK45_32830 [Burkholderia ubonensis]